MQMASIQFLFKFKKRNEGHWPRARHSKACALMLVCSGVNDLRKGHEQDTKWCILATPILVDSRDSDHNLGHVTCVRGHTALASS